MSNDTAASQATTPRYIMMHDTDNVAIVVNDGGLPAGTVFPDGLTLVDRVPQGHKVALRDLKEGEAIAATTWPSATRARHPQGQLGRGIAGADAAGARAGQPAHRHRKPAPQPPLEGYTFEGYRNADGSVGTRNILAITTTVQCVAGVVEHAVKRIRAELLPKYPNVDDVVALEHTYGCGVAIDAPDAGIPIRTLRNISLNPNFGGQAMVVSLGCESCSPTACCRKT
jgi:galactarate dehydratase